MNSNKKKKDLTDKTALEIDDIDGVEEIELASSVSDDNDDESTENNGFKFNFHIVFAIIALFLIGGMIFYLARWNTRSSDIDDSDVLPDQFDMENMDYYVYPDPEIIAEHGDDGKTNILFIGNSILTNSGDENCVINGIKERLPEANISCLATDAGKITSERIAGQGYTGVVDSLALVPIINGLVYHDYDEQFNSLYNYPDIVFFSDSENRGKDFFETLKNTDLNDIDIVIIMYSFADYYAGIPTLVLDNEAINCYYGALYTAVKTLQDNYPHLNIVLATPTPGYLRDSDGNITLSNLQDFGMGNSSAYVDMMYYVATKFCVSYIDNYFYGITDDNITDYVDDFKLTDKGVRLVSRHIVDFLEKKPEKESIVITD